MDYGRMNETDVREIIVRPFLEKLGYRFGSDAHIRTEVTLRYSRAYLGRKNPSKDPDLKGRADYICEVVPFGRWVVEVKAPSVELTIDDSEQAHTYATHPEIGAYFYLLTNGKEWQLFKIGEPQKSIISWSNEQTDNILLTIQNIIGPAALRKRAKHHEVDVGKPLGKGLGSALQVKGGFATYAETTSSDPNTTMMLNRMNGLRAPITNGTVYRLENGDIEASISMLSMLAAGDEMMRAGSGGDLLFRTTSEFISTDRETPTILTNLSSVQYDAGTKLPPMLGNPGFPLDFGITMAAFTQAVGFVEDERFRGTFEIAYLYETQLLPQTSFQGRIIANRFASQQLASVGDFDLHVI